MQFSTTEITSAELGSDNPIHQRLFFAYHEAAKVRHGQLLEIGCGVGRALDSLMGACDHYTGIDKNETLLATLRQKYPQAEFLHKHIPPLSGLPDSHFDSVITFQVIEHIPNDELFVKEIHRVLKPGGKLYVTTPNKKRSLSRNPWHEREYTALELNTLLQKYFRSVEAQGVQGNNKVNDYYEANRRSVERITRFDIFNLQYRLPASILRLPYEILNRMNRNRLQSGNTGLVSDISFSDHFLNDQPDTSLDLFYVAEK